MKRTSLRSWHYSSAYTILELMLALALLGALMTVAWSLMGTFRDAEQRGWKLAHRTQTIRATREWLENDVQHLLQNSVDTSQGAQSQLIGTSQGFTATIVPSLDPLPFLQELMTNPLGEYNEPNEPEVSSQSALGFDANAVVVQPSLWPSESLQVEYQLEPIDEGSAPTESQTLTVTSLVDTQFTLTRRERLSPGAMPSNEVAGSLLALPSAADRVLTAQDLYRQTDTSAVTTGIAIRESRVDGITNAQFQYFDGQSWREDWNSNEAGGLPKAIALCFDFPARADMKVPESKPTQPSSEDNLLESSAGNSQLSFADAALAAEPTAESSNLGESGLMQAATHEVQVIVYVGGVLTSPGPRPLASSASRQPFGVNE